MASKFSLGDVHWLIRMGVEAETRYPDLSAARARYRLGDEKARAYERTTMGGAVFQILRMLGWRHGLTRLTRAPPPHLPLTVQTALREDGALEVVAHVMPELSGEPLYAWILEFHLLHGMLDAAVSLINAPFHPSEAQPGRLSCLFLFRPKT